MRHVETRYGIFAGCFASPEDAAPARGSVRRGCRRVQTEAGGRARTTSRPNRRPATATTTIATARSTRTSNARVARRPGSVKRAPRRARMEAGATARATSHRSRRRVMATTTTAMATPTRGGASVVEHGRVVSRAALAPISPRVNAAAEAERRKVVSAIRRHVVATTG